MIDKYIKLLLERCLNIKSKKSLFINYDVINKDFVEKAVKYANRLGINDIYLDEKNIFEEHDLLKNMSLDDIKTSSCFDESIWDQYALKDAAFLILNTEFPKVMDDIDSKKIGIAAKRRRESRKLYRKKVLNNELSWCIAALPNEYWGEYLFPNSKDSLKLFWEHIEKICLLDSVDPILEWNNLLKLREEQKNKLNSLNIKKLHYKNSMGTDLTVELPENALWETASEKENVVNMPSYEIFTTPNYKKTNGIVYSSMPLYYNGKIIDQFYLKFKDGKVIEYDAKIGKDVLKEILESDEYSSYLGECALVNYNSPIRNTNIIFGTTLLDENASCHLALGAGFNECIKDGLKMNEEELLEKGINPSKSHIDFMIGTSDLEIVAETKNGFVTIVKDGNLIV